MLPIRPANTLTPPYTPSIARLATVEAGRESMLNQPSCFATPADSIVCLGWIQNTLDHPISNVLINFYLFGQQGQLEATTQIHPVLSIIPMQGGSPYRAIFPNAPQEWLSYAEIADFKLLSSLTNTVANSPSIDYTAIWQGDAYRVAGTIQGDGNSDNLARVVVTVRDNENRVTGFRVVELPLTIERRAFEVSVATLDGNEGIVSVEVEVISAP